MIEEVRELKKFRDEFILTRYEVCQELNIREMSLYNWENNNHSPSPHHRKAILDYMRKFRLRMEAEEKREIEKHRDIVLNEIYQGEHTFIPKPEIPGKFAPLTYPTGLLWRSISLWRLKEITKEQASETTLIKILQLLSEQGRIRLFHLAVDPSLSSDDVRFKVELGKAKRDVYKNVVEAVRLYKNKPLSKTELESAEVILNIQERIDYLRADKRKFFDERHGVSRAGEIEKEFLKEDRESETELRQIARRTADGIEKLAKDKEKN